MLLCLILVFMISNCARTTEDASKYKSGSLAGFHERFALWPSIHNGATLIKLHKREAQAPHNQQAGPSEGGDDSHQQPLPDVSKHILSNSTIENKNSSANDKVESAKITENKSNPLVVAPKNSNAKTNNTEVAANATPLDLNSPGVVKRALIVFGGFTLLAVAYIIFYRAKNKKNTSNANTNDANQFRYGVLHSDEQKDNLELSRMPLTMESEDDDDEDLEIFDLEQKRKSLSYVNLQTKDEDVVFGGSKEQSNENNILLDIDDDTDTLINWSSSNKIIL